VADLWPEKTEVCLCVTSDPVAGISRQSLPCSARGRSVRLFKKQVRRGRRGKHKSAPPRGSVCPKSAVGLGRAARRVRLQLEPVRLRPPTETEFPIRRGKTGLRRTCVEVQKLEVPLPELTLEMTQLRPWHRLSLVTASCLRLLLPPKNYIPNKAHQAHLQSTLEFKMFHGYGYGYGYGFY